MTSKLTKERLQEIAEDGFLKHGESKELARMALAAMDSEPVAVVEPSDYVTAAQLVGEGPARKAVHELYEGALKIGDKLYRHAQQPVVPAILPCSVELKPGLIIGKGCKTETLLTALRRRADYNDDIDAMTPEERAEYDANIEAFKAMLPQPAPVVPEVMEPTIEAIKRILPTSNPDEYAACIGADMWNACRAAMLQHQPQNAQQNIPENIPGGLVEAVNNLLNNDGSRGCYDVMECGTAREKIELWLAQRQRWEEQRKANLSAGNSPVIPDGYVMVPKEPTEAMMLHKSGCQHHAWNDPDCAMRQTRQLVWSLMIAAATQEVK